MEEKEKRVQSLNTIEEELEKLWIQICRCKGGKEQGEISNKVIFYT